MPAERRREVPAGVEASADLTVTAVTPVIAATLPADITTVFFDVGSTLLHAEPEIDGMFFRVACRRGHKLDRAEVKSRLSAVHAFYEDAYRRDGDFWCTPEGASGIFLDMYRYLAHLTGLEHDAEGIARDMGELYCMPRSWMPYDDVLSCLEGLKRAGKRMGVISNWAPQLHGLLGDLGFADYFDVVLASAEVGCRKPDSLIFQKALEAMGCRAKDALHVGDHLEADGIGAAGAGITPVIIDRKGAHSASAEGQGFLCISSLEDLLPLL